MQQNSNKNISDNQTRRWFWIFALAHLLIWTISSRLTRGNPPFDSVEGVAWGNQWQWGYDKHPPLAPWLTAATTHLFHSADWAIYFLGALSGVVCFWATWHLARKILSPVQALFSVFLLEGIYYYNFAATQFNPNVLMLPIWALLCLSFYNALDKQKTRDWLLVGLFAGLAIITKYESLLLIAAMGLLTLKNPLARKSFLNPSLYAALVLTLLISAPNFIWLYQHHFISLTYTTGRLHEEALTYWPSITNHFYFPLLYVIEQVAAIAPTLLLFLIFWRCPRDTKPLNQFDYDYLLFVGAGPTILVFFISLIGGVWIHSLWAFPFFSLLGIILFAWRKPLLDAKTIKRFLVAFVIIFLGVALVRGTLLITGPYLSHHTNAAHFPGRNIADAVTLQWRQTYHRPLPYVAGYRTIVEHVVTFSSDQPRPYFEWDVNQSAWIDETDVRKKGAVFVWFADSDQSKLPTEIAKRFPTAQPQPVLVVRHLTGAKIPPFYIGVAFLPPEQ